MLGGEEIKAVCVYLHKSSMLYVYITIALRIEHVHWHLRSIHHHRE